MTKKTQNKQPSPTPQTTGKTAKPSAKGVKRDAAGRFVKGTAKGNGGRKLGTPNKATRDARSILGDTLLDHLERLPEYLNGIDDDAKRIAAIASLLPFYMPKYQSTTLTADTRRSLSCEEEMQELDKKFTQKEIEISITEKKIINFDNDDD